MKIGISCFTRKEASIWMNGLVQNVFFLAQALAQLPFVTEVRLLDAGEGAPLPPEIPNGSFGHGKIVFSHWYVQEQLDVIIEMEGALPPARLALMRARGSKVVFHCCGQPYVALIETAIFERPGVTRDYSSFDAVWILSKDQAHSPMMRTLYRCPVWEAPYLWDARFLQMRCAEISKSGHGFGYKSPELIASQTPKQQRSSRPCPSKGSRIAVFEPNISVVKSGVIPALIADRVFQQNPQAIDHLHLLNMAHMVQHPTLLHLGNSLSLVKQHRATFHGRNDIAGFMAQFADAVVSHQWGNDQNYLYMDVLYGDYPLIHNSHWLQSFGAGYYYPDFDIAEGANRLTNALHEHCERLSSYRAATHRLFESVSPKSAKVQQGYADLLLRLVPDRGRP